MSTRRSPSISETTLSAARSGSFKDLEKLHSNLPQSYSLEVYHVFLHQLQGMAKTDEELLSKLQIDPDADPPRALVDRINSLVLSLDFFSFLPECARIHPELKHDTVLDTASALPIVFSWLSMYIQVQNPSHTGDARTHAEIRRNPFQGQKDFEIGRRKSTDGLLRMCAVSIRVLRGMLELDPFVTHKTVHLDIAIQVIVALWVITFNGMPLMQSSGVDSTSDGNTRREDAPQSGAANLALTEPRALDRLMEAMHIFSEANQKGVVQILASGVVCSLETFVAQTLERARITASHHRSMTDTSRTLPDEANEVVNIQHLLGLTTILMSVPPTREVLFKHSTVETFVDCIMSFRERLIRDGLLDAQPYQHRQTIARWSCQIFAWSVCQSGSFLSNLSTIVNAGMLRVVVDSFVLQDPQSPTGAVTPAPLSQVLAHNRQKYAFSLPHPHVTDALDATKFMLSVLVTYASYPQLLPSLRRQLAAVPAAVLEGLHEHEDRYILYRALEEEVEGGSGSLKMRNRVQICDNLEHGSTAHPLVPCTNRKVQKPQTCSKCHSVVYCSRECQRRDWTQRHRHECPQAHHEYTDMKHSNDWYSHPTRAFHLSILLDTFGDGAQGPSGTSSNSKPGTYSQPEKFRGLHPIQSLAVRCFDLTAKRQGYVYRPFANWIVVHGGKQIPNWKRHRFGAMTHLWQASQFAHTLRTEHPASAASPALNQPERHLADAQFLFGNRILHLVALIRKEDTPRQLGDRSHNYVVEGSFFFLQSPYSSDKRIEKIWKSSKWLYTSISKAFKGIKPSPWVAILPVVVFAVWSLLSIR